MTEPLARRATLADVARVSGMSKSAVSMILNDRPGTRLSEEAAQRVRAAAAQLGYRPNPAAQSLRLGRTKTIGFISDQVTVTRYASPMISGVLAEAKAHERTVLIAETEGDRGDLERVVRTMLDRRVDGLLVGLMVARMVEMPPVPRGVPVVIVNGLTSLDHPSILPQEHTAGRVVARHLLDAGHRRIGVIGDLPDVENPAMSVTIADRFAGITAVLGEAGVVAVHTPIDDWKPQLAYECAHRLLDAHPDLTAIIAGNDNVAFGIYQAAAARGIRIPDDLSVISFDDEEIAAYQRPGLTTVRLPYAEMGRRGVQMLLGESEPAHEFIPMPLIVRESVRVLD